MNPPWDERNPFLVNPWKLSQLPFAGVWRSQQGWNREHYGEWKTLLSHTCFLSSHGRFSCTRSSAVIPDNLFHFSDLKWCLNDLSRINKENPTFKGKFLKLLIDVSNFHSFICTGVWGFVWVFSFSIDFIASYYTFSFHHSISCRKRRGTELHIYMQKNLREKNSLSSPQLSGKAMRKSAQELKKRRTGLLLALYWEPL